MKRTLLTLIFIAAFVNFTFADDYEIRAKALRDSIWNWDMQMFKNRTIPDEYTKEPAVVIAQYEEINASGKSKFRLFGMTPFNKELSYTSTIRKLVKINDKSALETFSELSFTESKKMLGYGSMNTLSMIIGARIIKPDGTIKDVNVGEAVKISTDKKGDDGYKKLAITDLQIGDILDYFVQNEYKIDSENLPQEYFVFTGRYPILNYKVHVEINKKLTAEYRSINDAPKFTQTEESDVTNLDVEKNNISKIEMVAWTAPFRQLPIIRLNILNNASKLIYKPSSARGLGVYPDLDPDYILTDAYKLTSDLQYYTGIISASQTKKDIKRYKSSNPKSSEADLADFIFNAFSVEWGRARVHPFLYMSTLQKLLEQNKILSTLGFVSDNTGARLNEVMETGDLIPIVFTQSGKLYTHPTIFNYAGELRSDVQNESLIGLSSTQMTASSKKYDFTTAKKITIPTTSAEQNKSKYEYEVGFLDLNSTDMTIKLTQEHAGYLKHATQAHILSFYNVDKEKRATLDLIKKDILEVVRLEKDKNEWLTSIEEKKKSEKDSIKSDLEEFLGSKIKEVQEYKILSQGVTKKDSTLKYEAIFTIEGLIKKAGNSIIFNAGKLIGEQMKVDDEDRNRTSDAYMPYNRTFDHKILIYIPEDYRLENPENFRVNIQNEYASFTSEPIIDGDKLILNIKKSYLKTFVPLAEWKKVLEVIDGANVLFGQSIVLKKK